jgi:site-specific recombinase XerD
VNNGVSIYVVQGLLGHANIKATQRYAHLADDTLSQAAELIPTALAGSKMESATFVERECAA